MKKLFYLLLALPLVFAACEPDTPEQKVEKEAVLSLTSEATMNFGAEGGEGVITFTAELKEVTRYEPVPVPVVEAACEADWVTDLTVDENITFTVLANEAEARETKVFVSYDDKSFEVVVKQAAKEQNEEPEPEPDTINIDASYLDGEYYGDEYSPGVGNYFVYLSDLGFSEDGYAYPGGTYFRLDLYGPLFEGEGDVTLPLGTYNFDADDTMAVWTIGNYYSSLIMFDDAGNAVGGDSGIPYSEATLVVTESGATLNATIDGKKYVVTFEGTANIYDAREPEVEATEFTANYDYAYDYGDVYAEGTADNFFFFLSDLGLGSDGYEVANGKYYRFDIYTDIIDTTNGITLPDGTYEIDLEDSCAPGTFGFSYSAYYAIDESGYDYAEVIYMYDGYLVKEGNEVYAEVLLNNAVHTISFTGDITIYDSRDPEEDPDTPVDPEDPEDPEDPTPGEGVSTLTGDLELNIPNASYALEYYGDYYGGNTDNWVFYIYEDAETYNGAFIMLDFLSDYYADDIAATYTPTSASGPYNINTYFTGYIDGEDMWGCWYVDMVDGDMGKAIAPIADGDIKIELANVDGDDVYTITLDCVDDAGNKITGTIVANPIDYSAMALSATPKAKPAKRVANVEKVRLEAKVNTPAKSKTLSVR